MSSHESEASGPDALVILRAFVQAHAQQHPSTGGREPIFLLRHSGGHALQHHGLPHPPVVDEAILEEMQLQGLLDLDCIEHGLKITPAPTGRRVIEDQDRVENADPVADVGPLLQAVAAQVASKNKLGWPAVRPVLAAIRGYWETGGFSRHGVQVAALVNALPEEHQGLFAATTRGLIDGAYLVRTTELSAFDLPAEGDYSGCGFRGRPGRKTSFREIRGDGQRGGHLNCR